MAYLSTTTASDDTEATGSWKKIDGKYAGARAMEAHGGAQVADFKVWFSNSGATATIAAALCDANGVVYDYREAAAVAGTRRSDADDGGGNYIGRLDFSSATAPTSYSHAGVTKIDLMHGSHKDFDTNIEMGWRFGVTAISDGTVTVSVSTSTVI